MTHPGTRVWRGQRAARRHQRARLRDAGRGGVGGGDRHKARAQLGDLHQPRAVLHPRLAELLAALVLLLPLVARRAGARRRAQPGGDAAAARQPVPRSLQQRDHRALGQREALLLPLLLLLLLLASRAPVGPREPVRELGAGAAQDTRPRRHRRAQRFERGVLGEPEQRLQERHSKLRVGEHVQVVGRDRSRRLREADHVLATLVAGLRRRRRQSRRRRRAERAARRREPSHDRLRVRGGVPLRRRVLSGGGDLLAATPAPLRAQRGVHHVAAPPVRDVPQHLARRRAKLRRAQKVAARVQQARAEQRRQRRPLRVRRGGSQSRGDRGGVCFPACGVAGLGAAHSRGEVDLRLGYVREASVRARGVGKKILRRFERRERRDGDGTSASCFSTRIRARALPR